MTEQFEAFSGALLIVAAPFVFTDHGAVLAACYRRGMSSAMWWFVIGGVALAAVIVFTARAFTKGGR